MQRNTRWIGLHTAILLMIATAVAGAAPAKQDKGPGRAGRSPIYHLDVVYKGKPVGQVVVNTANPQLPSYVLVARGLKPTTKYTFGYTASGEVYTLGSIETPRAGALVFEGTFPLDDVADLESAQFWMREPIATSDGRIMNGFILDNWGVFVAKLACYYSTDGGVTWKESGHTDGIALWDSGLLELKDFGVPEDALVRIHAIVVGGKDRTGSEVYQCTYWSHGEYWGHSYPVYEISGTTWNPTLSFEDIHWITR
jgi:hypothetical protein